MRLTSSWRFTRFTSLLRTGVLICLALLLLWWPASGSEVSAALTVAGAAHAEQSVNGYGYSLDGDYLAVFAEEDEAGGKLPKNAALLGTLVLVLYLGLALGWIVVSGWMRRKPEVCSPIGGSFHSMVHLHQRRGVATLSGVFRL